jgi:hypothetical protein
VIKVSEQFNEVVLRSSELLERSCFESLRENLPHLMSIYKYGGYIKRNRVRLLSLDTGEKEIGIKIV